MAYFAELNNDNVVVRVLGVPDDHEHRGNDFLAHDLQLGGRWIQTSYNHRIRGHYAAIGDQYDETLDLFIHPQPFPSWTMNDRGSWDPPVAYPTDGGRWTWDETNQEWVEIV